MKPFHFFTLHFSVFGLFFFFSCSALIKQDFPDKLSGHWRTVSPDSARIEVWTQVSENLFTGYGGLIAGQDTLITETLKLIKVSDVWSYQATVPDQNDGKTISFTQTNVTTHSIEFSNPEHDFPQKLVYILTENDNLQVLVSGGTASFTLQFVKIK